MARDAVPAQHLADS